MGDVDFVFDPWLYVWTRDADASRRFFGAPAGWPCEFVRTDDRGFSLYRVKADGLTVR